MVFDRVKYKEFAKKQLKGRWLVPVLVAITISLITTIFNIPEFIARLQSDAGSAILRGDFSSYSDFLKLLNEASSTKTSILIQIIQLIVSAILEVASISVYIKMSRSPQPVSYSVFIEGLNNWWRSIRAFFLQFVWIVFWTFLFIIPGVIKAISYSQMYYLLAEFENMSVRKAMRISMLITEGYKGDIFMTYLSFTGLIIIEVLIPFSGFWITPYMNMTFTNIFHALLKNALETGLIKPEDLR